MTVSRRGLLRSAAAVVPAVVLGSALPGTARAAGAASAAQPQWEVFPVESSFAVDFGRMDFAANGAGWATGTNGWFPDGPFGPYEQDVIVYGWDGTKWTGYVYPWFDENVRPLTGVAAGSTVDAWAVGMKWDKQRATDIPQLFHWDGKDWGSRTGGAAGFSQPAQVAGSGNNVWVVGEKAYPASGPAVLRWNGSSWAPVDLPAGLGAGTRLTAVKVLAPDNVWVAGSAAADDKAPKKSLVLHWDGKSWTQLPAPFGDTAGWVSTLLVRGNEVWAGGASASYTALAARWDGKAWSVRTPAVTGQYSEVTELAAYGSSEVWAAGNGVALQRWNGTAWSTAQGPKPTLAKVGALASGPGGSLWLAGEAKDGSGKSSYFFARLPAAG